MMPLLTAALVALIIVLISRGGIGVPSNQNSIAKRATVTPSAVPTATPVPATATPTPVRATATPSAVPTATPPTSLYVADWSHGLGGWSSTADWKASNSMLLNDGTDTSSNAPTLVAPYQVSGTENYSVEVRMRVLASAVGDGCFDVATLRTSEFTNVWSGYKAVVCNDNAMIEAGSIAGGGQTVLGQRPFNPGTIWHTYLFEAQGTTLSLLIDGQKALIVSDDTYLSGGLLGLKSFETQLVISNFKVVPVR